MGSVPGKIPVMLWTYRKKDIEGYCPKVVLYLFLYLKDPHMDIYGFAAPELAYIPNQ